MSDKTITERLGAFVPAPPPEHIGNWVLTGAAPNRKLTRYDKWGSASEWLFEDLRFDANGTAFDDKVDELRGKAAAKARKEAWKEWMADHDPEEIKKLAEAVLKVAEAHAKHTHPVPLYGSGLV